jgi:DNA topoisomerase-3
MIERNCQVGKNLFIAEKPSVAREFAKALEGNLASRDGYLEGEASVVTWCVGHLVTMSYPEAYDAKFKRWSFDTIPFLPTDFKYEVIENVKRQFQIVSGLLNRPDVTTIYVCTDSGREGEYIYRLVEQMAGGLSGKTRKRVWIDSQTQEEILRGIREAKDLSAYDNLGSAAYLRAQEDYLMGINFSRVLTLKYGRAVKSYLQRDKAVISVGRVMTCVLGMVVSREREIRAFVKTPFYRVCASYLPQKRKEETNSLLIGEWKTMEGSKYWESPLLYKENGFRSRETAEVLIDSLKTQSLPPAIVETIERKKETKNPPLLYNLAELQNDCSKGFKISPDETLRIVQELYEKKLVTYPRTDARVLSTAVAKEIHKNISGLKNYPNLGVFAQEILQNQRYQNISKTRYVDDKQITDHYAIVPTGQGGGAIRSLSALSVRIYELIIRRFLSIFYPAAVYQKITLCARENWGTPHEKEYAERFFTTQKILLEEGYLKVVGKAQNTQNTANAQNDPNALNVPSTPDVPNVPNNPNVSNVSNAVNTSNIANTSNNMNASNNANIANEANIPNKQINEANGTVDEKDGLAFLKQLRKGDVLLPQSYEIKEGETTPPKRYNSGSMILAMENAGQLIEDEELRAQIKGSGIGTSATRAEILKKLVHIEYLALHQKTQILTPTLMGEMIFDVVSASLRPLLDPKLTASWEKGLTMVAAGEITPGEYRQKLNDFVARRTNIVKTLHNEGALYANFQSAEANYKRESK